MNETRKREENIIEVQKWKRYASYPYLDFKTTKKFATLLWYLTTLTN